MVSMVSHPALFFGMSVPHFSAFSTYLKNLNVRLGILTRAPETDFLVIR
jgi:hypothetical protein